MTQVPTEIAQSDIHTPAWVDKQKLDKCISFKIHFNLNLIQTFVIINTQHKLANTHRVALVKLSLYFFVNMECIVKTQWQPIMILKGIFQLLTFMDQQ